MLAQENFREKMIFSSIVPVAFDRGSLVEYLANRFTYLSENDWRDQIVSGCISRNGDLCLVDMAISVGDSIAFTVNHAEFTEPEADLAFQIIYEDAWLLAIDKPGNLLVHRQGRSLTHNLIYQLRYAHQPPYPQAGVVNRLDRETSGLVLVARQPEFLARLNAIFAEHAVTKTYLAVVQGRPERRQGVIDYPIGRDPDSAVSYRYCAGPQAIAAKEALTRYQVVREYRGYSLLRLQPESGRTHQLRVHLAHIGHPIMGDKLYGRTDQEFLQWRDRPLTDQRVVPGRRQALHAESLQFIHPWTGKEVTITAAMPRDMQDWLLHF
jgi:RluA family pseudouridine synthase